MQPLKVLVSPEMTNIVLVISRPHAANHFWPYLENGRDMPNPFLKKLLDPLYQQVYLILPFKYSS